ncbi:Phospholipase A2, major isoenzyme [Holothuria leucospilota]|uniref:Phospholipase A2 n=1 Tax=Holothuria leucospilota TaxID=206669 RepID=A0A9Q1C4C8_HOLLE|nr:Phospholipase A2, major isoenzyme [Holothuria leucospilota]
MKMIILFLLVGSASFTSSLRARRSVIQFGQMIECVTPLSALTDYNGYGCWCGYGGTGTPLDGTDRCCKTHDECYNALKDSGTCSSWNQIYSESYSFSCYNCDTPSFAISCGSGTSCAVGLCQCDKTAAECFSGETFNSAYRNYNKNNC